MRMVSRVQTVRGRRGKARVLWVTNLAAPYRLPSGEGWRRRSTFKWSCWSPASVSRLTRGAPTEAATGAVETQDSPFVRREPRGSSVARDGPLLPE